MDNPSSTRSSESGGDECHGTGFISQTIEGKHVRNEPRIYNNCNISTTSDAGASTSNKKKIGTCCDNRDKEGIKLCDVLKKKLQLLYADLALPKAAWLTRGGRLSIGDYFIQPQLNESSDEIKIEDVFNLENNKKAVRILIEGQPGYGKTTLALKLAYDWAKSEKYIDNFKFLFFVSLRELNEETTINDIIKEIVVKRCAISNADVAQIVNHHQKETLMILDELEEISQEDRREILGVLYKQIYNESTVLVFCRTGVFPLSDDELSKLFGPIQKCNEFYDKQISTLGITNEVKKREFLEKLLPKLNVDDIIKRLEKQWKLFNSPLILMLIPIIIEEGGKDIEVFSTRTQFYKKLFNCIIKHCCTKRGCKIAKDFDLFCLDSSPNNIQKSMTEFGMSSMKHIVERKLQFENNNLTEEIYKIGFLIRHNENLTFESNTYYEPLHLSIIEFTAAISLWMNFKLNPSGLIENDVKEIVNHFIKTRGTSLVMPFLLSLMEDELDRLLSLINPFSAWFCSNFSWTVKLFSECLLDNISTSTNLKNFIHFQVAGHACDESIVTRKLVKYGIECGKLKRILIDKFTKPEIFLTGNTVCFRMVLATIYSWCVVFVNIPSDSEKAKVFLSSIPFDGPMNEILNFAASSNCKSCSLDIHFSCTKEFFQFNVNEKELSKIKYERLTLKIETTFEMQGVINLLENDQVQYLDVNLYGLNEMKIDTSDFYLAAARSNNLIFIALRNCNVDLFQLTNGGRKKYTYMNFENCNLTCRQTLFNTFKNCCHHLKIKNSEFKNIKAIVKMEPSSFT